MSMESRSKKKALALWETLPHNSERDEILEHPVRGLSIANAGFESFILEGRGTRGQFQTFRVKYTGENPWKNFYVDLYRYTEYEKPWNVVWGNE